MIDFESYSQTMRLKSGHCSSNAVSAYERHKSEVPTHQATRITPPTAVSKRQPQEKLGGVSISLSLVRHTYRGSVELHDGGFRNEESF